MAMQNLGCVLIRLFLSLFIGIHDSSPLFNEGKREATVMPQGVLNLSREIGPISRNIQKIHSSFL